jgi:D-arabinose 1-dehydrogenase-like Zn-dependent alcohol dehydrogenase
LAVFRLGAFGAGAGRFMALTGEQTNLGSAAGDATLRFSALCDVAAMVETMPLERAADAYARMMSGEARFRMVLTMT